MTTDADLPPTLFDRLAGAFPAAAYSSRCGGQTRPRLAKPQARPDLATPDGLAASLGPRWDGLDKESPARRLALALLASQAMAGRAETLKRIGAVSGVLADAREADLAAEADGLLDQALSGRERERPDALDRACGQAADALLAQDSRLDLGVRACSVGHAFGSTVLLAVLAWAKSAHGVLPDAYFLWMRDADPAGWAIVADYGRPARFADAIAADAHHAAERAAGEPLPEPAFEAVAAAFAKRASLS